MTDNKQFQQVHEASWDMVNSFRETSQTVADSLVAIQDHNLKFTQNIFLTWMEMLTQQREQQRCSSGGESKPGSNRRLSRG